MAFGDQDLAIFFQDGRVMVALGVTAKCHLDYPEDVSQFGGQSLPGAVLQKPRISYPTATYPALKHGDPCTVDGVAYEVCYVRKLDDGLVSTAELKKG